MRSSSRARRSNLRATWAALAAMVLVGLALGVSGPQRAEAATAVPAPGAENRWAEFGPSPIAAGDPDLYQQIGTTSGRVNALAISPTDPDVAFIGTALGGVWRTTDGGRHWTPIFDDASALAVEDLELDGTTLWVGTGGELAGDGLYRIANAETVDDDAVVLEGPFDVRVAGTGTDAANGHAFAGTAITAIAIDPNNHDRMFVATNDQHFQSSPLLYGGPRADVGLYYTANAQAARPVFSKVAGVARAVDDALFVPGSSAELVVAALDDKSGTGEVLRTSDATAAAGGTAPSFATVVSFTGSGSGLQADLGASGDTVYAATSQDVGTLYKSTDRGQHFARGVSGDPGDGEFKTDAIGWGVGDHTGAVAVDPTDPDNVMLGGAYSCFKSCGSRFRVIIASTDGGKTFRAADGPYEQRGGNWLAYLHPDTVAIAYANSNPDIAYTGNDGGIYRTGNARDSGSTDDAGLSPVRWESLSTPGLGITQFYSLAIHPTDPNYTIGATQDNGAVLFAPDLGHNWKFIAGGDAFNVAIDQNATDTSAVTSYVDCRRYPSTSDAVSFASLPVTAGGRECQYPGRIQLGPGNPNSLYVGIGGETVWRSGDRGATDESWQQVTPDSFLRWTAFAVAPQDDLRRIFAREDGRVFYTTTGSTALTEATGAWPKGHGVTITAATFDPQDPDTAYIGLGGALAGSQGYLSGYVGSQTKSHVWKTTNLTAATPTWTAVGAVGDGLPDLPVRSLLVDPAHPENVFLGTDSGVFASGDGGAHWEPFGHGVPRGCTPRAGEATCAPTIQVRNPTSMAIVHPGRPDATLRIATHSRGMWQIWLGGTDGTAPTIKPTIDGTEGDNGWYTSDVTVSFDVADAESPYVFRSWCESRSVTEDATGAQVDVACKVSSYGGGAESSQSPTIKRDATPPTVTCAGTPTYGLGEADATVSATVVDATSGAVASQLSAPADTGTPGRHTVSLTGADKAGNETTASCPYRVTYAFAGFFQPIDEGVNAVKAGRTVPITWRLTTANGLPVTDPGSFGSLTSTPNGCTPAQPFDEIEPYAGNSGLRYLGDGVWRFNWKTPKGYAGQCRTLKLNLTDGSTHTAEFRFR